MITIIHDTPSIAGNYLAELRDVTVQKNKVLFRRNIQRLGVFMAYELSKYLSFDIKKIQTPLGIADCTMVNTPIVLGTILRAGLPMHQGFLDVFDDAENAFLTAFRKHHGDGKFDIEMEYVSCPNLTDKCLVLIDPMLATGASIIKAVEHLAEYGQPSSIHIVSAIASKEGLNQVHQKLPQAHIWIGDVDEELTAKSYIVPGLGDAGDLSFGEKCQD
ncbi:uracil phosphoribosyltransferase [Bacteroidota bacterium]|nr:uracil phosphoribosyltransferase [Bacteroidota bacterium]